ncbi:MAG: hypothetical protein PUC32_02070 [Oscillospiraceae bacterium]|nr:hypothetical protein [Oscillospiraceae bacterium]
MRVETLSEERGGHVSNDLHYFVNTNSCEGFFSFFKSNFSPLALTVKLEDYPAPLLETVTSQILHTAKEGGYKTEVIHNCLDNTVEGVILPQFGTGLLNIPAYIDYGYNVSKLIDDEAVRETKSHLIQSHRYFAQAKKIHDDWEKIYIEHSNYAALNQFTQEKILELLGSHTQNRKGSAVHRFFGAATEEGAVDYIDNLTEGVAKRYLIKGRPGTGKSTFLKKLAERAVQNGFDVEVYHCAFDPRSLDMVVVRALEFCIFDSTAPHECFPQRDSDEILDFYEIGVAEGTDEIHGSELKALADGYKEQMEQGRLEIAAANQVRLEREGLLFGQINPAKAEQVMEKIEKKLFRKG